MININICICFDNNYFTYGINLIKSILDTTRYNKSLLYFYILVDNGESNKIINELNNMDINFKEKLNFKVKEFNPSEKLMSLIYYQKKKYEVYHKKLINKIYYNYLNYARYYISDYFPELDRVIFIDADIEFKSGIENIYFEPFLDKYYFAAIENGINFKKKYANKNSHPNLPKFKYYSKRNIINTMTFNAGIYITLLSKWKEYNIIRELEDWIEINNYWDKYIFSGGTQAPLNIVFCDNYERLTNKIFVHYKGKIK